MKLRHAKSFRDRNQLAVGAVGLILLASLVASAFAFGATGLFKHRYRLSAVFDRTGGLERGADVRVAGIAVGAVTAIRPDFRRGNIVVSFDVDRNVRLGPDTTAAIAAATLLGGYYLRLDGPVRAPYLDDLATGDPRRRIPLERTEAPVSLNQVIEDASKTASAIDFGAANRVIEKLAGAAKRNATDLPTLIDNFATVSAAIAARDHELRQLANNAAVVTQALAARDTELAGLVEASHTLLAQLVQRRDDLATLLGSSASAVEQMNALLGERRGALDATLNNLSQLTSQLADVLPAMNRGLAYAATSFPLIAGTLDPAGGFSIRGEGLIAHPGQIAGINQTVRDLLAALGIKS